MATVSEAVQPHSLRGAARASRDAQIMERRIAFWVVLIPFLALLFGIFLLLRSAVGRIELLLLFGMYWVSHIGIGLGYHRHFSHRSFQTTRPIKAIFALLNLLNCNSDSGEKKLGKRHCSADTPDFKTGNSHLL